MLDHALQKKFSSAIKVVDFEKKLG